MGLQARTLARTAGEMHYWHAGTGIFGVWQRHDMIIAEESMRASALPPCEPDARLNRAQGADLLAALDHTPALHHNGKRASAIQRSDLEYKNTIEEHAGEATIALGPT